MRVYAYTTNANTSIFIDTLATLRDHVKYTACLAEYDTTKFAYETNKLSKELQEDLSGDNYSDDGVNREPGNSESGASEGGSNNESGQGSGDSDTPSHSESESEEEEEGLPKGGNDDSTESNNKMTMSKLLTKTPLTKQPPLAMCPPQRPKKYPYHGIDELPPIHQKLYKGEC